MKQNDASDSEQHMELESSAPTHTVHFGKGPFIFCGEPPNLVGEIELINQSESSVRVRALRIAPAEQSKVLAAYVSELKIGACLRPRSAQKYPARLVIGEGAPPGQYNLHLLIGNQEIERIRANIWERAKLRISPSRLTFRGISGDVVKGIVVVANQGNVPQKIPELTLAYLEEHEWLGRAQVYALRETKEDDGFQKFLDNLIRELRQTLPREAEIRLDSRGAELLPGNTVELQVEMTLPEGLRKGRLYDGFAKFMSGEMKFRVACNGASNSTKRR